MALALIRGRLSAAARPRADRRRRGCARRRWPASAIAPTPSQVRALAEIDADLAAPTRMLRLLQGDVGSGKTLVALLAMLRAVEAGAQAALMAPTEMLAQQHHRTLARLSPVPVALLTGSVKGRPRALLLRGLADGSVPIVVGTHALFQEAVEYRDLAVAVIDEQHRFGVEQRLLMGGKGEQTDVLVMTATPIPRTLLLTHWGEMEISRLTEKPAGRQPIRTTLHSLATLPDVLDAVARKLAEGAQVYWVCPLVAGERGCSTWPRPRSASPTLRGAVRRRGRPGAWPAGQRGARSRAGRLRRRAHAAAGGDDGDRGRRRCAGSERDGDRARRTLRPGAAAPVARPRRARRRRQLLPAAARRRADRARRGAG